MKKLYIAIAITALMAGCSSFSGKKDIGMAPPSDTNVPVKDTKLSTNFSDEGVKIYYTTFGKLEKIEVTGQAPAWKRNVDVLAESDAMDKLVKFIHGKSVTSERRVKIISKAIDNASDVTSNKYRSVDGTLQTEAKEIEDDIKNSGNGEETQKGNTANRKASILDQTTIDVVQSITARGVLVGVRKIGDSIKDDGKTYVATYQWSQKDMDASLEVRKAMSKSQ
jgi:hypothetical protein